MGEVGQFLVLSANINSEYIGKTNLGSYYKEILVWIYASVNLRYAHF